MNHPTAEEWMAFLYGETSPEAKETLQAHLHVCPPCQATVDNWRATIGHLQSWRVPAQQAPGARAVPVLKWAIAALFVLGVGVGVGRLSAPAGANPAALRAALLPELRQELSADVQAALSQDRSGLTNDFRRQLRAGFERMASDTLAVSRAETQLLLSDFIQTYNLNREQDQQATLALCQQGERQRRADYASLRKDLETVAVVAENRLQQAQYEIGELASNTRPTPILNNSNRKGN